ncbi:MarR family transcriptional regulator [Halorubrum sp. DTA98]|uniref:MarR family transcriptional regulator n=1 Tax=Halorubrum sp. DTA98 TaxID=3402163 RepID=UPI003AB02F0D
MNDVIRDRLSSLPPSAKLVYYVLEKHDQLDQTGVAEETRLSTRTVRFAIEKLSEAELVDEGLCPTDARRSVYQAVTEPDVDEERPSAATAVAAED